MDAATKDVSIVIVTWNRKEVVRECLESIRSCNLDSSLQIIIVDNASSDGTPEIIAEEFRHVCLIRNSQNLGFARANNIGIAKSTGKYVCLVNSDVKIADDCLDSMRAHMEANLSVGAMGPRMLCPNGQIGRSYMRFPGIWRGMCNALALHRIFPNSRLFGGILMSDFDNNQTAEVDVLNGWFLMVRREALEEVGFLDDRFFMYGEDIDWSYRFHKAGWKRVYFAGAVAFHYGGASSSVAPARFYVEMKRANLQLCRKHYGTFGAVAFLAITWLHESVRLAGYALTILAGRQGRSAAVQKTKRSLACMKWLLHPTG